MVMMTKAMTMMINMVMTITMMILLMMTNDDRYDKNDDEEGDNDNDDNDHDDNDDDDIYIMMKCLFVTKNHHFLLGVSCNHLNHP